MTKAILIFSALFLVSLHAVAQRDTSKTQSIDITSSFKPVLRNAVKINFSGSQLVADTGRPLLAYTIPSQNLFYAYQPITLKPLALVQDTNLYLGGRNFLKAGFGNYSTPYVSAGLSFGDGKTSLFNLYGTYTASKGNDIEFQDYSVLNIKGTGSYFTAKNEVYASTTLSQQNYYLYGYDHARFNYKKEDIRQQFQDITFSGGIRNTVITPWHINYNPSIRVNFFTNKEKLSETTLEFNAPVEKKFGEELTIMVAARGDFTNYSTKGLVPNNVKFANNIVQVAPAFEYKTRLVKFHGGVTPSWSNGDFSLLPDIFAEVQLQEKVLTVQAGWIGRYTKNTYRNLSAINPYLQTLTFQENTQETEYYGGIKASVGKHFNFSAKAGVVNYKDMLFFINDTATDEKSFVVRHEPSVSNFRVHGDVSYINQDKFTATAGVTFNAYTGMRVNNKAWHTIPMEFTSSLRWWAFDRLLLKGDFYFFNGGNYITKAGSRSLGGGTDLSAGAEFRINKQFSAWGNINNILNDKYERWHNYPVYGLNATGGILINF